MTVVITSFGYKKRRPPNGSSFTADVRDIPVAAIDGYWQQDGRTAGLQRSILNTPEAQLWIRKLTNTATTLGVHARISIGCNDGRHRAVAIAETLADTLAASGIDVTVTHLEVGGPQDSDRRASSLGITST